jgi:hypothetical protein
MKQIIDIDVHESKIEIIMHDQHEVIVIDEKIN